MPEVATEIRKLKTLTGHVLQATDGEIGKLKEIYFDEARWTTRYFVAQTSSWLLGRDVLSAPRHVIAVDSAQERLEVTLSRAQIEACPSIDTAKPVSKHYEDLFHEYYGLEPYWAVAEGEEIELPARPDEPIVLPPRDARAPKRPHLRSSREVCGYRIDAIDASLGHIDDFLISTRDWRIRFLEVDTRNWLPGKHVLLAPAWIDQIDWGDREVSVRVNSDTVKAAPEYEPGAAIGPDDEIRLLEHYGTAARSLTPS